MANYQERKKLIKKLQRKRDDSTIITYFTMTDRGNTPALLVSDDAIKPLHTLLERVGQKDKIELLLYTRGGAMMTAYTLVKMFREYATKFNVLIPFRAHSAGTQIALGADNIVMTKIGQLSPIDPTTANYFNPVLNPKADPTDPRNRKQISVEDVQSYFNLAKDRIGLVSESDSLEIFKELTKCVEPLALGNVNRVYLETRVIAREMLVLHMDPKKDEEKIARIIKALTEEYTHNFIITRSKADDIGLNIKKPTSEQENLIMKIYDSYETEMKMNIPFDAEALLLQSANPQGFKIKLGAIESVDDSFIFMSEGSVYPAVTKLIQNAELKAKIMIQPGMYPPKPSVMVKSGNWYRTSELSGDFV